MIEAVEEAVSRGWGRDMSDYARSCLKQNMLLREKFGEDYDLVSSLLERVPADDVVAALMAARRR